MRPKKNLTYYYFYSIAFILYDLFNFLHYKTGLRKHNFFADQHLIVHVSDLFIHVLDLGIDHEPCCHFVVSTPATNISISNLIHLPGTSSEVLDITSLDIYQVSVSKNQLFSSFWDVDTTIHNRLSILHYILVHKNDMEMINEVKNFLRNEK